MADTDRPQNSRRQLICVLIALGLTAVFVAAVPSCTQRLLHGRVVPPNVRLSE